MRVLAGALLLAAIITGIPRVVAGDGGRPGPPTHLTVDDDTAPLAVTGAPAFGWQVNDARRGALQSGYELLVATVPTRDPLDEHVIWRSGQVHASVQSYVTANGIHVQPDRTYWWTVRTWDAEGHPSSYATPARFDTGLADGDWHASWIRDPGIPTNAVESFSLARKVVRIGRSPIVHARANASAGQQYELSVNGARVAHGPSFAYPDEQYYETTDIRHLLRAGELNAFAFVTHWSTPGQGRPASEPGVIARITVDHADGTREVIATDGTWRVHAGPWMQGPPRNEEGDFVERIDARLDQTGWERAGFDDSSWTAAAVIGAPPVAPFTHLIAARTHIVEHALRPVSVRRATPDAYVADFGAVTPAVPVVQFVSGGAGRRVTIIGGDLLDADGRVSSTRGNQATDMHWEYVERDGRQTFRPFGYLAFRYLEVDGAGEALAHGHITASARRAAMPDVRAATFRSSSPALDRVWNLAWHSALYSSQEQFLDTPTREKGQFLADAENISTAAMRAFGERALTEQALRDFARSRTRYWPDGRVNAVYPNGDGARDIPDFTERYVEWAWRAYVDSGNRALLRSLYPTIAAIADYVTGAIDPRTGLVTDLPGGDGDYLHGIVDWPPAMRYGYDVATAARTTVNALAVAVFADAAAAADATGRPHAEADGQRARAAALTTAIQTRLERTDGLFVDGLEADGTQSPHASQHANAYALAYGLVPKAQHAVVARYLAGQGTAMGPMTADVLLRALHAAGRDDALVTALTDPHRPGWAQILARGATFTWESWNARDVPGDSESHGWGSAILAVLQSDLLGVRFDAPGAARIVVAVPTLTRFRAAGMLPTQRGPVRISWYRADDRLSLDLAVPANVTAVVRLPARRLADVRDGSHSITAETSGVQRIDAPPGEVALTLGSGRYRLTVNHPTLAATI